MSGFKKPAMKVLSIFSLLFLVGCSMVPAASAPAAPTMDPNLIRTEAAQTVVAQMNAVAAQPEAATQTPMVVTATSEASAPSPVPVQPQPTLAVPATATPLPTITPYVAPTTVVIVQPTTSSSSGGSVAATASPYKAVFISQSPYDGAKVKPNEEFDAVWTVKNTGTKTWTSKYYYRFAKGDQFAQSDRYYLKEDIKPGATVKLIADMKAPAQEGKYLTRWELVNDNGERFFSFYLAITVEP